MADQINVSGKVSITLQFRNIAGLSLPAGLQKLGEQMDMTEPEHQVFLHNVPGDRNGGPEGPPIEVQYLGEIARIRCDMSRWDPTVWDFLRKLGVKASQGTITDAHVGQLILTNRAVRVILISSARPINFPCCIVRNPYVYGMGTKFSRASVEFEAHRTPGISDQSPGDQANIFYDSVTDVYASGSVWA
jgi:hypothetical protein